MKKNILLLLAVVLCISLCACGGSTETNSGNNTDNKTEESGKEIVISKEELATCSEYIELTTENWNDYIEIVEKEIIEKDAFGEETGRSIRTFLTLKDNCYISEDNAIRLTYARDYDSFVREHTEDFVFASTVGEKMGISIDMEQEIICEKVKGTILKLTVPAEKWNTDKNGDKYFCIQDSKGIERHITKDTVSFDDFVD